jgi:hypothetical protein
MNLINQIQAMCVCRVIGVICVLVIQKVQCDRLSFNDVIDSLPTDSFVKVFFEGNKPYDIFETRTPITLWHHREDWYLKYNKTYICKLFHIARTIGSRTNKIFNIVQIQRPLKIQHILQNHTNILRIVNGYLETPDETYREFLWFGANTRTVVLGNIDFYRMFTHDFELLVSYFRGEMYMQSSALLFDLRPHSHCWKVCKVVVAHSESRRMCADTIKVAQGIFEHENITYMTMGEIRSNSSPLFPSARQVMLRKYYFKRDVNIILANEVVNKYNASYHIKDYIKVDLNSHSEYWFPIYTDSFVLIDDFASNFLSCYTTPVLTFEMYVQPFELKLWLCIGSCLLAIALFIYIYNRNQELSPSFSPFFFFASTLFEEPYSVPTALWNDSKFKIITAAWLLTSIVFTNLYTGHVITELSVPLKGEILHSLEDIFGGYDKANLLDGYTLGWDLTFWDNNSKIFTKPLNKYSMGDCRKSIDYSDYDSYHQQFRKIEHFALLQAPVVCETTHFTPANERQRLCNPSMYKYFDQFHSDALYVYMGNIRFNPTYEFYVTNFISPKHRHYPREPTFPSSKNVFDQYMAAAVEKEIVACGKSIFIAESNELQAELRYLQRNYLERKFYVGNGTIEQGTRRKLYWNYQHYGNPVLAQYLKFLLQAGIRTHISTIQSHKTYLERRIGTRIIKEKEPPAMGMDMTGSIQTIFIILSASLVLASFVFIFEFICHRRNIIYMILVEFFIILAFKFRRDFIKLLRFKLVVQANCKK